MEMLVSPISAILAKRIGPPQSKEILCNFLNPSFREINGIIISRT
jgi:hypothetical protein